MKIINNRLSYSEEDLKILKASIEYVKSLNWNNDKKVNKKKSKKKECDTYEKRAA